MPQNITSINAIRGLGKEPEAVLPAKSAQTLYLSMDGVLSTGTFSRTTTSWNPETGALLAINSPLFVTGQSTGGSAPSTYGVELHIYPFTDSGHWTYNSLVADSATQLRVSGGTNGNLYYWQMLEAGATYIATLRGSTTAGVLNLHDPYNISNIYLTEGETRTFVAGSHSLGVMLAGNDGLIATNVYLSVRKVLSVGTGENLNKPRISTWGDSMTYQLANYFPYEFPNNAYYNGGVGGETSTQIKTRMLAATDKYGDVVTIWAGRNNYGSPETVKADVAAMVAAVTSGKYVVIGVCNADLPLERRGEANWKTMVQLNADLAATYPNNFIDMRTFMISRYNPAWAQDIQDYTDDLVPASLRNDEAHFSYAGSMLASAKIADFIRSRGWNLGPNTNSGAILMDRVSTNVFLNSSATSIPTTQSISLTTANAGKWCVSHYGPGNTTSSAGTATATGYAVASNGTPHVLTVTGAGTVVFTVAGATNMTRVQVENLAYPTSLIETGATQVQRTGAFLDVLTSNILTATQGTVMLWVELNQLRTASSDIFVFMSHRYGASSANDAIILYGSSSALSCYMSNHSGTASNYTKTGAFTGLSGWHHLALTWSSARLSMWLDGVEQSGYVNNPNLPSQLHTSFAIGYDGSTSSWQPDMPIDKYRVFSRALTANEIYTYFNRGR